MVDKEHKVQYFKIISVESTHEELLVYPNPTNNQITIVSSVPIDEVFVYNALENIKKYLYFNDEATPVIDITELASGMYFLRIIDVIGKISTVKVFKN